MERLTKRLNNGTELCIEVCGEKCVDGYTWCPKCKPFSDVMKKLAEYEDAEEQGLILRLPVPEGTKVHEITKYYFFDDEGEPFYSIFETTFDRKMLEDFGKTVFLTKEEAEQALAKMKEV